MDEVKTLKMDAKRLEKSLREEFERCIAAVVAAVDGARIGAIIDDSEEPVRQATGRLRQQIFEKAIQMKTDAAEAAFSPSASQGDRRPPSAQRSSGRQP